MNVFRALPLDRVSSGCTDIACGCSVPVMRMTDTAYTCGHCGCEVYPRPGDLLGHEIECHDGVCVWTQTATGLQVHRCGSPATVPTLTDDDLAALLG